MLRPNTPKNLSEKLYLFKMSARDKKTRKLSNKISDQLMLSGAFFRRLLPHIWNRELVNAREQIRTSFGGLIGSRVNDGIKAIEIRKEAIPRIRPKKENSLRFVFDML